jgi:nucleoside-diphosphate-sugar epimerase
VKLVVVGRGSGLEKEVHTILREHGDHVVDSLDTLEDRRGTEDVDVVLDLAEPGVGQRDRYRASRTATAEQLLLTFNGRMGRYVFVSSVLAYAPVPSPDRWPIQEHFPRRAHGDIASRVYGQDCIDAEDLIIRELAPGDLTYAILRPTVLWGSTTPNVSSQLMDAAQRQPWAAARDYDVGVMQWVDVRDAARAVVLAATEPTVDKDIFTIAGAEGFTAPDVVRALWQGTDLRQGGHPPKFDIAKAGVVLGWRPEHGIGRSLASFDEEFLPASPSGRRSDLLGDSPGRSRPREGRPREGRPARRRYSANGKGR